MSLSMSRRLIDTGSRKKPRVAGVNEGTSSAMDQVAAMMGQQMLAEAEKETRRERRQEQDDLKREARLEEEDRKAEARKQERDEERREDRRSNREMMQMAMTMFAGGVASLSKNQDGKK